MIRLLVVTVLFLLLVSCSRQPSPAPPASKNAVPSVLVSAAASTKDLMESLASKFSEKTKVEVKINPGPSNGLATQIIAGAPADLFLSASAQWSDEVQKAGHAAQLSRLLTNRLVLVVPKDNPAQVHEPKDLLSPRVKKIALAGEQVPAGKYADQALTSLELFQQLTDERKIVRGQDVRSALSYIERGEVEAGIVYPTDVGIAKEIESVYEFDPGTHEEIVYVLVLLTHGDKNPAAREFYEFLQSPAAVESYARFGFARLNEQSPN